MSVVDKLNKIRNIKSDIRNSIEAQGVSTDDKTFEDYPDLILDISGGSSEYSIASFVYDDNIGDVDFTNVTSDTIPLNAFTNKHTLTGIDAPSITSVASDAFSEAVALRWVNFAPLQYVRQSAFSGAMSLENISFDPNGVSIEGAAFQGCTSLTIGNDGYINHMDTDQSAWGWPGLADDAFAGCASIGHITLETKYVGMNAFYGCASMSMESLPSSLKTIGANAFYGCISLNVSELPDTVIDIGDMAFVGSDVSFTEIPRSVQTIGYAAFGMTSIEHITIHENVTELAPMMFMECASLETVVLDADFVIAHPDGDVFSYIYQNFKVYVPDELVDSYKEASGWSDPNLINRITPISALSE